jgi:cation:H+ antiporter
VLAAGFGIALLGLVVYVSMSHETLPEILWVSPVSFVMVALYLLATRTIFHYEQRQRLPPTGIGITPEPRSYESISSRHALAVFGFNSGLIIVAASILPYFGDRIASETGLADSFVGLLFIALATSLPEVVVALTAISIGASDLALGGLLGSNLFNIAILGVTDVIYRDGSIYAAVASAHTTTAGIAILMTAIAIVGLTIQPSRKPPYLAWDAMAMIGAYAAGIVTVFVQT